MKPILLLILALLSFPSWSEDYTSNLAPLLKKIQNIPEVLTGKACDPSLDIDRKITKTKVKNSEGKEFEISEISEDYVKELFDYVASQKHIPFDLPEDGCYARAHEMALLLEEKGVITGKTFIEGNLRVETKNSPKGYVEWWYHVAPIVSVRKKDGSKGIFVLDPSIFKKAVPAEEWYEIQTKHAKYSDKKYFTPRFNYTPGLNTREIKDSYEPHHLRDTKKTMETYLNILKSRKKAINDLEATAP